jgi:NAD(P)H-hydrate repair Nnr-like enzyme with NAD(P)H-hydrate dehydratase domain
MSDSNWLKQTAIKPLYEDLLWSRPENKTLAGKLLIVGGNSHGFRAPAVTYNLATKAGAGIINILLPESLRSIVGQSLDNTVFIPANKSGGFGQRALAEFLDYASNSDLTLLAGDFGHNSETTILLESFLEDYNGPVCLTDDAIDAFYISPSKLFERPDTLLIADTGSLQKLLVKSRSTKPLTTNINLIQMVDLLSEITKSNQLSIVTYHQNHYIVAVDGQVSTTEAKNQPDWYLMMSAYASTWWLQNMSQKFKAITTSIYDSMETS